jgi:hypothetical protein
MSRTYKFFIRTSNQYDLPTILSLLGGYRFGRRNRYPVTNISWDDYWASDKRCGVRAAIGDFLIRRGSYPDVRTIVRILTEADTKREVQSVLHPLFYSSGRHHTRMLSRLKQAMEHLPFRVILRHMKKFRFNVADFVRHLPRRYLPLVMNLADTMRLHEYARSRLNEVLTERFKGAD